MIDILAESGKVKHPYFEITKHVVKCQIEGGVALFVINLLVLAFEIHSIDNFFIIIIDNSVASDKTSRTCIIQSFEY